MNIGNIGIGISLRLAAGMLVTLALAGFVLDRVESSRIEAQLIADGETAAAAGAAAYEAVLALEIARGVVTAKDLLNPVYDRIRWPVETCPDPQAQPSPPSTPPESLPAETPQVQPGSPPTSTETPPAATPQIPPGPPAATPLATSPEDTSKKCIEVVPPRYHVGWDRLLDASGIAQIQDAIMRAGDGGRGFAYASGMNIDGYVPTSHAVYNDPPVGDVECTELVKKNCGHDVAHSRQKQQYLDPERLGAARSIRAGWQQFMRNGRRAIDVFSPISIVSQGGRTVHWGAFRVGVILDRVDEHHRELTINLAWLFGAISVLMGAMLFFVIDAKLFTLVQVADLTLWMGTTDDPKNLDRAMKFKRRRNGNPVDEVDRITMGVDRMRRSLKSAMEGMENAESALRQMKGAHAESRQGTHFE